MQVSVAPHSFNVAMGSVSPPPVDALGLGLALMEVMRGTAVSFSPILTVINSCNTVVIYEYNILVTICTASCQSTAFRCSNGTCILFSLSLVGNSVVVIIAWSSNVSCYRLTSYMPRNLGLALWCRVFNKPVHIVSCFMHDHSLLPNVC